MKYINKNTLKSLAGKALLDKWKVDNQTMIAQLTSQKKKKQLWNKFPKKIFSDYLYEEQNGLCCYCGCELTKRTHRMVIEHYKLKSLMLNNLYPNMFDYDNLFLSCHGNCFIFYQVKTGDTWASIAAKPECIFLGDKLVQLQNMNPLLPEELDENNEPKIGEILIVGFFEGADNHHCDNYRGDKNLSINPSELPNCIDRFIYTVKTRRKEGEITPKEQDNAAEEAIKNLNLNAAILVRQREQAVEDARNILQDIAIEMESIEVLDRQDIITIANKYVAGVKGFYVVYRAYLKDDFPELFQD
jgi:hypothetical protein